MTTPVSRETSVEAEPADHTAIEGADGKWAFGEETTRVFDEMLERSIPEYRVMRELVTDLALAYHQRGTTIVDLGCSRGEALAPLVDRIGAGGRFLGLEISAPMLAAARARFAGMIDAGIVGVELADLRLGLPANVPSSSVVLSVLTLMFVPVEHRWRLLRQVRERLLPGGALVLVEKVLGGSPELDAVMTQAYLAHKARHGYSQEEIDRKRLALEGVLVPWTAAWNEEALRAAGFRHVETFWRWHTFAGWIALP